MRQDNSPQSTSTESVQSTLDLVKLQLTESQKIVSDISEKLVLARHALINLAKSNQQLADALKLATQTDGEGLGLEATKGKKSAHRELASELLPECIRYDKKFFQNGEGKVLLALTKAYISGEEGITARDIAHATGYAETTIKAKVGYLANKVIGTPRMYAHNNSETARTFMIEKLENNKWALKKRPPAPEAVE